MTSRTPIRAGCRIHPRCGPDRLHLPKAPSRSGPWHPTLVGGLYAETAATTGDKS